MKKLAYITYDYFLDVDYPMVKELNKYYQLLWIVYIKVDTNQRFSNVEVEQYAKSYNIELQIINVTWRFRSLRQLLTDFKTILKLRRYNAHIYYFETFANPYQPILAKVMLPTKNIVVAIHDVVPHKKFRSTLALFNEWLYFRLFNNYHLFSKTQAAIYNNKYPNKNVLTARLFLKDFGSAVTIPYSNNVNFLFFGVIQYNKGLEYLIEASNLLANEFNNFTITIAGKCSDFTPYQKMIKNPAVFELIIKIIPNADIARLFKNAQFLVLPYRDVTQSGPLLIAYNYRVPVIASDFPGFKEYIENGKTGYLFEPCNSKALYDQMKFAIETHSISYDLMVANLNEYVDQEISLGGITNQYIEFFENVIHGE